MSAHPQVCILLATHQGAAFLDAQLESFEVQKGVDWAVLVSDDSPQPDDGTGAILTRFRAKHAQRGVRVVQGPQRGYGVNFLSLLQAVPEDVPYAALSDQDDVWFEDKLARAVKMLEAVPLGVPALYCAATMVTDVALTPMGASPRFGRAPAFENALVQSIGGGNTMVLNRAALDLVRAAAGEVLGGPGEIVAHDWWLYQIISGCGGQVLRDGEPVLYYRQHGGNAIGANRSFTARAGRLLAVMGGRLQRWNRINMAALSVSQHRFTPEARAALAFYKTAQSGGFGKRMFALKASGVWRQGRVDSWALKVACVLHRL